MALVARTWFALSALLVALSACSARAPRESAPTSREDIGSVGFALTLPSGAALTTVSYVVTGPSIAPISGNIAVGGSGATASVFFGALPAGSDYSVTLTGTANDGTACSGSATFSVLAGQTVGVSIALNCRSTRLFGRAHATSALNQCPIFTSVTVAPLQILAGGNISVSATASDADGDPLTFSWSASPGGSFAAPSSPSTQYLCAVPGTNTLTVAVRDTHGCTATLSADVLCSTDSIGCAGCGDGRVQIECGEVCDPPNGTSCAPDCTRIPTGCGNGIVQAGEQCDPPNGVTCSPTCLRICSHANCQNCAAAQCPLLVSNCQAHEPGCDNLLACMHSSHCADGKDPTRCYCGSLSPDACFDSLDPSLPPGPCKAEINALAGSSNPLTVARFFADPSSPIGAAIQQVTCEQDQCRTECCSGLGCGDGVVGSGEQCDPPDGVRCDSTCQLVCPAVPCGDGVFMPQCSEQCDPPNGTTCDSLCHLIPTLCGNQIVQPGEDCDPPNGTSCSPTCSKIVCGDSRVEGPEQCDPPNGTTCSTTCNIVQP